MPTYEYRCGDCDKAFELRASITEYARGIASRCPRCGSTNTRRQLSVVGVLVGGATRGPGSGSGCLPGSGCCG